MKPTNLRSYLLISLLLVALPATYVSAQRPTGAASPLAQAPVAAAGASASDSVSASIQASEPRQGDPSEARPTVRIGPGDELDISVFGLPDLTQHVRVGSSGDISQPLVGSVHLAGLSSDEAQAVIENLLARGHYVNNPHVSVYVKEYTTEGMALVGEVSRPGVYPALGAHRLLDLIQSAGGLTDKAGSVVTVSHRDEQSQPLTLTLSNDAVKMAENNIELLPGDTVVVSKAGIVYVVGEVNRPGGFVIENNKISASQLIAMAAGPTHLASLGHAKIIRHTSDGLIDVPLSLQKILQAKAPDVSLEADDIIFVPVSKTKDTLGPLNIANLLLSTAIYHVPY